MYTDRKNIIGFDMGRLQPNCSESVWLKKHRIAVFRFHTIDPKDMQKILQYIADEISANTDFEPHKNQEVPLFETPEEYHIDYNKPSEKEYDLLFKKLNEITGDLEKGRITREQANGLRDKEYAEFHKKRYPKGSVLQACAGLGDNDVVVTVHKDKGYFTLNIGNNDINPNTTSWVESIKAMGIQVEEATYDKELQEIARDCTCGIEFGFGGPDE